MKRSDRHFPEFWGLDFQRNLPTETESGVLKHLLLSLICCALSLPLAGCDKESLPRGVVAFVDGRPIHLRTLETMLDTRTAGLGAFEKPSLVSLRQQYGTALTSLIAHVIVMQELDSLGLSVTESVVREAENAIRKDYSDEEFERNLTESALDPKAWRELLGYRTGMRIFLDKVLRPRVAVSVEEVEAYYAAHESDFFLPALLDLCQIVSTEREPLKMAAAQKRLPENSDAVQAFCFSMRPASVPSYWQKDLRALQEGEFTPVRVVDGRFEMVHLRAKTREHKMDVAEAYPYIEQLLQEEQMNEVFEAWLETRLKTAKISVSKQLVEDISGAKP